MAALVVETDEALGWTYDGGANATAVAHTAAGTELPFDPTATANQVSFASPVDGISAASFTHTFETNPCESRHFVLQLGALEAGAVQSEFSVANISSDEACDDGDGGDPAPAVCGCRGVSDVGSFSALLIALAMLRHRRRGAQGRLR
jgi:hypothetical protein